MIVSDNGKFNASREELRVAELEIECMYINENIPRNIGAIMQLYYEGLIPDKRVARKQ